MAALELQRSEVALRETPALGRWEMLRAAVRGGLTPRETLDLKKLKPSERRRGP